MLTGSELQDLELTDRQGFKDGRVEDVEAQGFLKVFGFGGLMQLLVHEP